MNRVIPWILLSLLASFPSITLSANPQCSNLDAKVLILGAGMSGVNAARTLYDNGTTDFIVIEAKSQIGGRMVLEEIKPGVYVELGANWIQGIDSNQPERHPLFALAQRCGGLQGNYSDYDSIIEYNSTGSIVSGRIDYDRIDAAYANVDNISITRQNNGLSDITAREALLQSNWTVLSDEDKWLDWYYFDYCFAKPPQNTSLFYSLPLPTYTHYHFQHTTLETQITQEITT